MSFKKFLEAKKAAKRAAVEAPPAREPVFEQFVEEPVVMADPILDPVEPVEPVVEAPVAEEPVVEVPAAEIIAEAPKKKGKK